MATGPMRGILRHLRRAGTLRDAAALTDGQLLERFLARRDEAAFEALVKRHGPMVLGVCRRVLGNAADAEDAFQATFLVLVRKAHAVRPRELVGNWLHGVAYRTALRARSAAAQRRAKERQVVPMPRQETPPDETWRDVQPVLDRELNGLPEKYRVPIVLCDLEGKTRRQAARQLGWPEGTLSCRLARGRALLARRLARHGLNFSGAGLALGLAQEAAAAVPPALLTAVTRTALAGGAPAGVALLAEGVLKAMLWTRLKVGAALVLALGMAVGGTGVWRGPPAAQAGADGDGRKTAAPPLKEKTPQGKEPERIKRPPPKAKDYEHQLRHYLKVLSQAQLEWEQSADAALKRDAVTRVLRQIDEGLRDLRRHTGSEQAELEALDEIERGLKELRRQRQDHRQELEKHAVPLPIVGSLSPPSAVAILGDRYLTRAGKDPQQVPTIRLHPDRKPAGIDFHIGGRVLRATYELQGDTLRIRIGDSELTYQRKPL
jgi:RNA polymerase sigma factor (sigma-70 family)